MVVALVLAAFGALSSPAYGLSGAASSGSGGAAEAQYRSVGHVSGRGTLPFTGLTVAVIALVGVAALGAGFGLRRVWRDPEPDAQ